MNSKTVGTLLHITSLPNEFSIGDLGSGANRFVDFLADSGQTWWQILPIGSLSKGHSPYQLSSVFAGNPLFISPERLLDINLLKKRDLCLFVSKKHKDQVNYSDAIRFKTDILKKAFKNFEKISSFDLQSDFDHFVNQESFWLTDFSLFMSIAQKERTLDWTKWDRSLRLRNSNALKNATIWHEKQIRYHQFIQWQFWSQWKQLKEYANRQHIKLIGDLPLFVSHQSADVWVNREIFKLNAQGQPSVVAGVPPDYFSKTGQIWNVPVYNWKILKNQKYDWWIKRLKHTINLFDLVRLDHFIGFFHIYEIPASSKKSSDGHYKPSGGFDFFNTVHKKLNHLPFIAEDLGTITPDVQRLRDQFHLPGTRVFQFELEKLLRTNFKSAYHQCRNSVLYTGTHDNNTTKGWYNNLLLKQRSLLCEKFKTNSKKITWTLIEAALLKPSKIVILPMQDILSLGSQARMNLPGTVKGNWKWRLQKKFLNQKLAQRLLQLIKKCKRVEM